MEEGNLSEISDIHQPRADSEINSYLLFLVFQFVLGLVQTASLLTFMIMLRQTGKMMEMTVRKKKHICCPYLDATQATCNCSSRNFIIFNMLEMIYFF